MAHGENCFCARCAARRYTDNAERALYGETRAEWRERVLGDSPREEPTRPSGSSGLCGDCGGTGDCIHCNQGFYPGRDGQQHVCGKCHGRTRRGRYQCHACKGKGYGGQRCGTPTYEETVARNKQAESRQGKAAYGRGSQSGNYGSSAYGMTAGTYDGYPSLSRTRDDGTVDIFYGPNLNLDDPQKGHVVIKNGIEVHKRPPGARR